MLELRNVSVRIGSKQILENVSLSLRPHRLTALVGRNGSGKSTLLACVNRQIPYTGQIREGEQDLAKLLPRQRAQRIAILPQSLPMPHIPVEEMVAFGRNPYLDFTGRLTREDKTAIADALRKAEASDLIGRFADTLSGGEGQRVALAMILAQNTPIALLDEPTAHMDQAYEAAFLHKLRELKETQGKTILVILHDLTLAAEYADDLIVLEEGKVVFAGTKEDCLAAQVLEKTFALKRYTVSDGQRQRIFFAPEEKFTKAPL